ncbi:MAG: transposase family protein [Chloroflexi bacterium]|nr:transposase family protein [Chloroflexota bacterium]
MPNAMPPLIEVVRPVPDPRRRSGVRHPAAAVLALACTARWCGYRSYHAIAAWGRNDAEP